MRTAFTPLQLTDPHLAEAEKNLRAWCFIAASAPRLPNLCSDRRRAGRPARPHRAHAEYAGEGRQPRRRDRASYRPLASPGLACRTGLVRRAVDYAPAGRRSADPYPDQLSPPAHRQAAALADRDRPAASVARTRAASQLARLFSPFAFLLPGRLKAMARLGAASWPAPPEAPFRAVLPNPRRIALMPGCVQAALCARDRRRHRAPSGAPEHRACPAGGRRLLRLAGSSSRPQRGRQELGPPRHRGLGTRRRGKGARRRPHHRDRLLGASEGSVTSLPGRSALAAARPRLRRRGARPARPARTHSPVTAPSCARCLALPPAASRTG